MFRPEVRPFCCVLLQPDQVNREADRSNAYCQVRPGHPPTYVAASGSNAVVVNSKPCVPVLLLMLRAIVLLLSPKLLSA
jgi:hypothetical protein